MLKKLGAIFRTTGASAAILACGLSPLSAADIKFAHVNSESHLIHKLLMEMSDQVRAETDGRVDIAVYPNAQLGGEVDTIQGILLGTIGGSGVASGALTNFVPELGILNLPYIFDDNEHFKRVWSGPFAEKVGEETAAQGIKLLCASSTGFRNIMTRSSVESIDDLKSKKIRTMESSTQIAAFNSFGALATPLPYTELYSGLQTGLIDGGDAGNRNYEDQKFYEVAPFWAMVGWVPTSYVLLLSQSAFDAMSPEDQALVEAESKVVCDGVTDQIAAEDTATLKRLEEKGVTVTYPDLEPFKAASAGVMEDFVGDDPVRTEWVKLIDDAR